MARSVYDFRPGRSLTNVNPQAVGEELERIRADKGQLVPGDVLEAAADPSSPLHAGFEWDDTSAAQAHRLNQARRLITSIRVLNSPAAKPTTAYLSVRTPQGRSYVPTVEALSDDDLRIRALAEAVMAIEALQKRYASFEDIVDALDRMKKAVG